MLHSRVRRAAATPAAAAPAEPAPLYDLSTGSVDTALFPARSWGRIQKELLYQRPELLQRGEMQGDARCARRSQRICQATAVSSVPRSRSWWAPASSICSAALHICSGTAWRPLRTPLLPHADGLAEQRHPCTLVDIDREGLPADALEKSGANLCYLTPSHHFPTGVTMPAPRRAQLLAWAAAHPGRYILEDDYDSEFRFDTRPLPSLQGMAG